MTMATYGSTDPTGYPEPASSVARMFYDRVAATPHTEAFQAVVWHLLVSHPLLKRSETKWESTK